MAGLPGERAHLELLELASIEALGALDPAERGELATHLRTGCAACLAALHEGRRVTAMLGAAAGEVAPSAALRPRVLASVGARAAPRVEPRRAPHRPRRGGWLRAVGVAAALLVAAGTGALFERGREPDLASLVETIEAPATRVVSLAGGEGASHASARAFVAADGQIALLVQGLPPPPPGRTYQLWLIEGGVPASAGTFVTSAAGGARHAIATRAAAPHEFVLAVTLEPAGGVPQPTGPIVLAQR